MGPAPGALLRTPPGRYCVTGFCEAMGRRHKSNRAALASLLVLASMLGPAGLRDMAKQQGFPHQTGDFGQTLHVWGFPEGPYIMIPILGPSNLRDGIGLGVDSIADPIRFAAISRSRLVTWGCFGIEGI